MFKTLAFGLLLLAGAYGDAPCTSDSDCPGIGDPSNELYCCPTDRCCEWDDYHNACETHSDCPQSSDSSDEIYCCPDHRCCDWSDYDNTCVTEFDCVGSVHGVFCCGNGQCCNWDEYYTCNSDSDCPGPGMDSYLTECCLGGYCCNDWLDDSLDWIEDNLGWMITICIVIFIIICLGVFFICCLCPCCILYQRRKSDAARARERASAAEARNAQVNAALGTTTTTVHTAYGAQAQVAPANTVYPQIYVNGSPPPYSEGEKNQGFQNVNLN